MANKRRSRARPILAALLYVGILVVIAFLVVVDIVDDVSRHEAARAGVGAPIVQEILSAKPSKAD